MKSIGGWWFGAVLALGACVKGGGAAPEPGGAPRIAPPEAGARIAPAEAAPAAAPEPAAAPTGLPGGGLDPVPAAVIAAARADAKRSWERLAAFCDHAGPRLAGSAGLARAISWAAAGFAADKVPVVRQEPVMVPVWTRGHEAARMVAPTDWELAVLGLGGSVPTPPGGIEAELVRATSLDAVPASAAGRIVLFDVPMAEGGRPSKHYGPAAKVRGGAPVAAAKAGAVGVLVRSVTTRSLRSPHTGATYYAEGVPKIPAAAVSTEDADRLARELARGPVRVRLELASATAPDAPSANVVAEIPGRTLPQEVVLIGAHIDSWDVGQGAHDDGAGVIEVMEAMRLLVAQGQAPKRTIRAVLFTNEENGLRGGLGYAAAHGAEVHVAAIETDLGGGRPEAWSATGTPAQIALLREAASGTGVPVEEGGGGADIGPLKEKGVMVVGLVPDHRAYFDVHHTEADTVDKVDPAAMAEATGALAALAWRLANH